MKKEYFGMNWMFNIEYLKKNYRMLKIIVSCNVHDNPTKDKKI